MSKNTANYFKRNEVSHMNKKALAIGIEAKVCEWIYTQLEEKS